MPCAFKSRPLPPAKIQFPSRAPRAITPPPASAEPHAGPPSPTPHPPAGLSAPARPRAGEVYCLRHAPSNPDTAHYAPAECYPRDPHPDPSQLLIPWRDASAPPPIARVHCAVKVTSPKGQHTPSNARAGSHVVRWERAAPPRHAPRACASDPPLGLAPPPCPRTLLQSREGHRALVWHQAGLGVAWNLGMGHLRIFEPRLRRVKSGVRPPQDPRLVRRGAPAPSCAEGRESWDREPRIRALVCRSLVFPTWKVGVMCPSFSGLSWCLKREEKYKRDSVHWAHKHLLSAYMAGY